MVGSLEIRTPDQRVRVFISSTLQELAPERAAARNAIERLHLTPVMFELGARPHPPRELYRAYLAQSQIFVGVYAERYGWVAPGESVSGLEDEYVLSTGMPRLIYVKAPSGAREERLDHLLDRIRDDDTASYKSFASPEEFAMLLEDDLALMMSERFDQMAYARDADAPARAEPHGQLTTLLGREPEVARIRELLTTAGVRLVTIVGSGGAGKTRIALELMNEAASAFADGVWFVDLSTVREPDDVLGTIAQVLGVREQPGKPIGERLVRVLNDRKALVVLDNFEQVIDAAVDVVSLLQSTRGLSMLVTSRSPLRVGGERTVEVGPLPPDAAYALFVERARAVRTDAVSSDAEASAVGEICRRLDRLPLAIELAAARMISLTASGLLDRIGRTLPEIAGRRRDLPARQRTLRDTIAWSVDLLTPEAADVFTQMSVFTGSSDLEAMLAVCRPGTGEASVVGLVEELVDASLIREEEVADGLVFSMLMTVHEFGLELLESGGDAEAVRQRHDDYFLRVAEETNRPADVGADVRQFRRLALLQEEVWAAGDRFAAEGETEKLARLAWSLMVLAWAGSQVPHLISWVEISARDPSAISPVVRTRVATLADSMMMPDSDSHDPRRLGSHADLLHRLGDLEGESFARTMLGSFLLSQTPPDFDRAEVEVTTAHELAARRGVILATLMARATLGRLALMKGDFDGARTRFETLHAELVRAGYEPALIMTLNSLAAIATAQGRDDEARVMAAQSFNLAVRLQHQEGIALGFERLGAFAAREGDMVRSARLLGAGRRRREISLIFTFQVQDEYLPQLYSALGRDEALREVDAGFRMAPDEAIAYAQTANEQRPAP